MENKTKWLSRKLLVWVTWTVLVALIVATGRENISADQVISFYGAISLSYIGGNVVQKYVEVLKTKDK